ncbi:MAG: hypothetical protein D6714_17615, partial [Bacteroidetes bacterium]
MVETRAGEKREKPKTCGRSPKTNRTIHFSKKQNLAHLFKGGTRGEKASEIPTNRAPSERYH